MKFELIRAIVFSLTLAIGLAGCSEPQCPSGWTKYGNTCRRCPPGMERIPGMCVPVPGDGGTDAGDAGEAIDGPADVEEPRDGDTKDDPSENDTTSCSVADGGCSHVCTAAPEGRRCTCPPGHALQADGTSCQLRSWKMAVPLETSSGGTDYPQVAADADGNAAVVWEQQFGDALYVWLSTYSPARGWAAAPEQVSGALPTSGTTQPHVQLYDGGNVLVVWSQTHETWVRKRLASGSWVPAERLSLRWSDRFSANQSGGVALVSSLGYTENTDAGVVHRTSWFLDLFDPMLGWRVGTLPFSERSNPQDVLVMLDDTGRRTVVWKERISETSQNLWAQRSRTDETWEAPVALQTNATIGFTRTATNGSGDHAVVTWAEADFSLWAGTFSTQSGWSVARQVTKAPVDGEAAVDSSGNTILLWRNFEPVFATHYAWAEGWSTEERVSLDSQETDYAVAFADGDLLPRIAFLPDGSAVAVWPFREDPSSYNGRHDIWSNVYLPGSGWQTPTLLENDDAKTARDVRLATSSSGTVFAIWTHHGPNGRNLWASRFE